MIQKDVLLTSFNSFGVAVKAPWFVAVDSEKSLISILKDSRFENAWVLGGGTNTLFVDPPKRGIIKMNISGIEIVEEDAQTALVKVGAGVDWHHLVLWALEHNLSGIENLALIPGQVGAAPIQNIGAYGVELKDVFHSCRFVNRDSLELESYDTDQCQFGYRDSVFKNALKNKVVISYVWLRLVKNGHSLKTGYGAIESLLDSWGCKNPSAHDVARAVIHIRQTKLPDPKELGNAGSFFKNPIISIDMYKKLLDVHPDMPSYPASEGFCKIPAAWLIEKAGLKGKREGDVGIHKQHALVLVNYGAATGKNLVEFSKKVQKAVIDLFEIRLVPEVNIL